MLRNKLKIGFDPKLHNKKQLQFFFGIKNIVLKNIDKNLIDMIWDQKPKDPIKPFFSLSKKNAGQSSEKKIEKVKHSLLKNKADYLAFGAFFLSKTKKTRFHAKIKILHSISKITRTPLVAIGGINSKNYKKLLLNKANFLAISGYIWNNKNLKPLEAIKKLK